MILVDTVVATGISRLTTTDQSLHGEDGLVVKVALLLLLDVVHNLAIADLDHLVGAVAKELVEAVDEMHIKAHLLVGNGDIATGLIGDMHIVPLLDQSADGAPHRDDIIVGMRREDDDALGIGQGPFRTGRVVGIRLAARPSRDGVLQLVEHLDIHESRLSVELLNEVSEAIVHIVFLGEFQ